MAIDFPNSPTVDDLFTVGGRTWKWNGTAWLVVPLPGGGGGLVYIDTLSLAAVTSDSLDSVFSSDYDDYLLLGNLKSTSGAGSTGVYLNLRASSTDDTSSNYAHHMRYGQYGSSNYLYRSDSDVWAPIGWCINRTDGDYGASFSITLHAPHLSRHTRWEGTGSASGDGTDQTSLWVSGAHKVASSFDGFTLSTDSSGLLTGDVRVYGYAKS